MFEDSFQDELYEDDAFDDLDVEFESTTEDDTCTRNKTTDCLDPDEKPLYPGATVTIGAFMLLIALFCTKHNLIGDAVLQLLNIIAVALPNGHNLCTSLHAFKMFFRNLQNPLVYHHYCCYCLRYIKDHTLNRCPYAFFDKPLNQSDKPYFLEMPVDVQVKNLFSQTGFFSKLQERFKCKSWIGILLVIGCCFLSAYTGDILGRSWGIVRERHERYRTGHVRYPYPAMGEITYGKFGRLLVSFSINFTLFGVACVFLLIAAENIQSLLSDAGANISFCYWSIIIAGVLTPLTWLGTPSDFWFVAVGATCATAVACVILLANMIKDKPNHPTIEHSNPDFLSFFTAFGVICFAFGGHPAFPTFQTDMRNQKHFGRAVLLGYLIVLAMYLPVSLGGYFVYGQLVKDNVLDVVSNGYLKYIVQILITIHLLLGFIIVINPFCQELEHLVKIPETFTYKRIISRTMMVICVLFVAETVPHFGAILSLVGGSTTTLLAYVCPSLFYLKLCKMKPTEPGENWEPIEVPFHVKVLNYEIILLGICAGAASTISAINSLVSSSFSTPCYIDVNRAA